MNRKLEIGSRKSFGVLCCIALLGLGAIAQATPTTYTRGTGAGANWTDTAQWTPTGYPGSDAGDTGLFATASGYLVAMDADDAVRPTIP